MYHDLVDTISSVEPEADMSEHEALLKEIQDLKDQLEEARSHNSGSHTPPSDPDKFHIIDDSENTMIFAEIQNIKDQLEQARNEIAKRDRDESSRLEKTKNDMMEILETQKKISRDSIEKLQIENQKLRDKILEQTSLQEKMSTEFSDVKSVISKKFAK
jgi:hypothetical protein